MRASWSGSLSFGLINIPVKIYSGAEERALKFHLLDKQHHTPISYLKVSKDTGKEVKKENIVKGYEYQKGDYVILTEEDFKKALPRKTKTIDIVEFVDEKEIGPEYAVKPYFIEPDPKSEKAYVLLRDALKQAKKVGVAKFVFHDREHIAAIKPNGMALELVQLRYQEELREPEQLHIPDKAEYTKREFDIALALIEQLTAHFNAKEFHDTYSEQLQKVITQKAKGKPIHISREPEPVPSDMHDLMNILKRSLEQAKTAG